MRMGLEVRAMKAVRAADKSPAAPLSSAEAAWASRMRSRPCARPRWET